MAGGASAAAFAKTLAYRAYCDGLLGVVPVEAAAARSAQNFESDPRVSNELEPVDGAALVPVGGNVLGEDAVLDPLGTLAVDDGDAGIEPPGCGVPLLVLLQATVIAAAASTPAADAPARRTDDNLSIAVIPSPGGTTE